MAPEDFVHPSSFIDKNKTGKSGWKFIFDQRSFISKFFVMNPRNDSIPVNLVGDQVVYSR